MLSFSKDGVYTFTYTSPESGQTASLTLTVTGATGNLQFVGLPSTLSYSSSAFTLAVANASGTVSYASSDSSILSISGNVATVTGVGTVTITATSGSESVDATFTIGAGAITAAASYVAPSAIQVFTNNTSTLSDIALPTFAEGSFSWYNPSTALVANDLIPSVSCMVNIVPNDTSLYSSATIYTTVFVSQISLALQDSEENTVSEMIALQAGETLALTALTGVTGNPVDQDAITIAWASESDAVVTVDASGMLTAVAAGATTLTCTVSYDGEAIFDTILLVSVTGEGESITALSVESINTLATGKQEIFTALAGTLENALSGVTESISEMASSAIQILASAITAMTSTEKEGLLADTISTISAWFAFDSSMSTEVVFETDESIDVTTDAIIDTSTVTVEGIALAAGLDSDDVAQAESVAVTVTITQQAAKVETSSGKDAPLELSMSFSAVADEETVASQLQSPLLVSFELPDSISVTNLVIQHTSTDAEGNETIQMLYAGDEASETTYLLIGRTVTMRVSSFSTFTLLTPSVLGPDIIEDGVSDVKDAILLQQYLDGTVDDFVPTQTRTADVDASASIDEDDTLALLQTLMTS